MKEPQKKEFQNRIASAGRKELLLIHFDMILAEMELIESAFKAEDLEQFRNSIQLTSELVKKLVESLDFSYEISYVLMRVYQEINTSLIMTKRAENLNEILKARNTIEQLKDAFVQIEIQEEKPLIENSEMIYAGLTYGKNNQLKESINYQKRGLKA